MSSQVERVVREEVVAPVQAPAPTPAGGEETTRTAGRGGLAIAVAKVAFILFGFATQFILPRLLGTDGYGEISRVLAWVSVVNNVIVAVAIQGVSRAISSVPDAEAERTFRRVLQIHLAMACVLSAGFALLAGPIATLGGAPHVTAPLRLVAAVILLYGAYAPLVGSLNGRRRFLEQAGLDIGYSALRAAAMIGCVVFFLRVGKSGAFGAAAGFTIAAGIIAPIAALRAGFGKPGGKTPETRAYFGFLLPLIFGQACLNTLMATDSFLLSRFAGLGAASLGLPTKAADDLVGVYRSAQLFAFLPYQMLMSVSFILFPLLARAKAEGDREAVRNYTRTGVRLAVLLTGLMCGVVSALAPHVLRVHIPNDWAKGENALRILALGMGAFSVLGVTSAALTSLGHERKAAGLTATGVVLIAAGCYVLVPGAAFGPAMLLHSAIATSIALAVTATVAGLLLSKAAGGFVAPATLGRAVIALAITIVVGMRMPWIGVIGVPLEAILLGVIYVGALVVMREVGGEDLARIKQVVRRKRA